MKTQLKPWTLAVPVGLAAAMYARFFAGFWLGDDFPNLNRMWLASLDGELWTQTWSQFFVVAPAQGAFYRPLMIASLAVNEWLAGTNFAGWFLANYIAHLANIALVGILVVRFAAACGRDGRTAGAIAASFFALSPLLAEGVFWVSARADAYVTLLTLAGVYGWSTGSSSIVRAMALPLLLTLALGFKESAAVLPLQIALVALAWPVRLSRIQISAIVACFAVVILFFLLRAHFFGDVWRVYRNHASAQLFEDILGSVGSMAVWWKAITQNTPGSAAAYLALSVSAYALTVVRAGETQRRLAAALICASAGLAAATLLNLGGMPPSGEGGRLTYTPMAWLALAIGVASARRIPDAARGDPLLQVPRVGPALFLCATIIGAWILHVELRTARSAQDSVRDIVTASREWAAAHPGLTLLVVEEHYGPIVTLRNAQGALVMPPVQAGPLLHRVLPTLPDEFELRYDQLSAGLASRLDRIRPSRLDPEQLSKLLDRDVARWPDHYACWSTHARQIVAFAGPETSDRAQWAAILRDRVALCETVGY